MIPLLMAPRRTSYGLPLDAVLLGLGLFALMGLLWWARPGWWFACVVLLGLPAIWLVLVAPLRSRDSVKLRMRALVLSKAPPPPGALVLDAGTGRGLMATGYAKAAPGVRVVGLDPFGSAFILGNSPAHAMSNAEAEGAAERVELVRGSVTRMPFGDGVFDLVVSALVVHSVSGPGKMSKAFEEAARAVRPGGRLVYVDFVVRPEQRRMIDGLGSLGLVRREDFDVPLGAHAWVFEKEGISPQRRGDTEKAPR